MKVQVDQEKCIGCGHCEMMCNQCFKLEGDKAQVIKDDCSEVGEDCVLQEVIDACPTSAIEVIGDVDNVK